MSYKSIFKDYILLIALCLFVVIYIINNLDVVKRGDIYNGDLTKSILLTAIIVLLIYLFVTWDDQDNIGSNTSSNTSNIINNYREPKIPKFNLGSIDANNQINKLPENTNTNTNTNIVIQVPNQTNVTQPKTNGESKYFVINQNTIEPKQTNPLLNLSQARNSIDRFNNQNIFIPQKNTSKFGIKF
jgi:hypothetical protein